MFTYFYDIIIPDSTISVSSTHLWACLDCLREYNLPLNNKKCKFFKTKIIYLRYIIN